MDRHALIAGVSGIVGRHLAEHLIATDAWKVTGISRHNHDLPKGVKHIPVDLQVGDDVQTALKHADITHLFITAWLRQPTEAENRRVNAGMVRNLLHAVEGKKIKHAALVTGAKHYMGPFEAYAKTKAVTPFREEQPRLPYQNFYYDQEDEVFAAADRQGFSWSVHRPHTLIGYAVGNQMNMAATLGAYAAICGKQAAPLSFQVHRSSMKPSWISPTGASSPSTSSGPQRSPLPETMPSTSSMVKCFAGIGCGRNLPNIWAWLPPNIPATRSLWNNR